MKIFLIAASFPSHGISSTGVYVRNLVDEWRLDGHSVHVCSPISLSNAIRHPQFLYQRVSSRGSKYVSRPIVFPLKNYAIRVFGLDRSFDLRVYNRAVFRSFQSLPQTPDFLYAHFLAPSGLAAAELAQKVKCPLFLALGESNLLSHWQRYEPLVLLDALLYATGIISVSEKIANQLRELEPRLDDKILIAPNRASTKRFFPRERDECRRALGIEFSGPLISFVGQFIERKGYIHVLNALKAYPGVRGVFMGKGHPPHGEQVLFAGTCPNEELPLWLGASDAFMLPTRAEGSSNAVAEAIAMGLPLIVSDIPEIHEQVFPSSCVFADPAVAESWEKALRMALVSLPQLKKNAVENASDDSLEKRAKRIMDWISNRI